MRIRIGKLDFKIPWEYLAAILIILVAVAIMILWMAKHERGETIRVMVTETPAAAGNTSAGSKPQDDDRFYDVPDADDEESRPGREPSGSLKVNINKAGMDELVALPYIGEVKARAIIEYREEHGPFNSIEDLLNVKGIGPKTLEKIRDYIVLE